MHNAQRPNSNSQSQTPNAQFHNSGVPSFHFSHRERWRALCIYMEKKNPYHFTKPYDLRDRLFEYACAIVYLVQYLRKKDDVARTLGMQILRAGNSAGANYEEADDGSSPADTRGKRRISLRELKETLFRLRVLRATGYLTEEHDPVIAETLELKRILATLIRKSTLPTPQRPTPQSPTPNSQLPTPQCHNSSTPQRLNPQRPERPRRQRPRTL